MGKVYQIIHMLINYISNKQRFKQIQNCKSLIKQLHIRNKIRNYGYVKLMS